MFYILLSVTAFAACVPPLIAAASFAFGRRDARSPNAGESPRVMPPARPDK
jgi:hypothetical protein